ncbi:MAG: hypothetical protein WBQ60_05645 [Asticcacaulis sp.]
MDIDREIDAIFKKLDQRVTDPEVACAALKQLIKINFLSWASGPQIGDIHDSIEAMFQNYIDLSNLRKKSSLKAKIHAMRAQAQTKRQNDKVEWLT